MLYEVITDEAQAHPYGAVFHGAPDIALVDVREEDGDPMARGVPDERVNRVEPHGLVVEQRRVVLHRLVVEQPRGLIRQQPERRGVGLGKAERRKGDSYNFV